MKTDSCIEGNRQLGFERAASTYDEYAVLQRQIAEEMLERLQTITIKPAHVIDVGCGTGFCTRGLHKTWPAAQIVGFDLAAGMVQRAGGRKGWFSRQSYCQADAASLPLKDASTDVVFSNLMMQWCDPAAVFAEFRRVLNNDGLLMFSSFGPDTLKELRQTWATVDDRPHVIDFADMHDHGDALLQAGFREPVMDVDRFTLTYSDVLSLLRDLHGIGSRNVMPGRRSGLMGRDILQSLTEAYQQFADNEGRLPASYEVVYGHAWSGGRSTVNEMEIPIDFARWVE
ncbi:MAG: malonyl-ACP O-methyltransferase BioC [Gammaproteobacteria bacterium]|nr:malonyl-ACP O-methyltransferase BioC [Gammaproteobacteria bacterium]